jgi:hypothetical protein
MPHGGEHRRWRVYVVIYGRNHNPGAKNKTPAKFELRDKKCSKEGQPCENTKNKKRVGRGMA